jgi:hypothetical protein
VSMIFLTYINDTHFSFSNKIKKLLN